MQFKETKFLKSVEDTIKEDLVSWITPPPTIIEIEDSAGATVESMVTKTQFAIEDDSETLKSFTKQYDISPESDDIRRVLCDLIANSNVVEIAKNWYDLNQNKQPV